MGYVVQPIGLDSRNRQNNGLGIAVLAIPAAVSAVSGLVSTVHFLQYPDDKKRMDAANGLYNRALGGDRVAEAQLRLLSHVGSQADIDTMKAAGIDPQCAGDIPGGCGWATNWAQKYGQAKLAELAARRAAGQVGSVLIGQSDIPSQISATMGRAFGFLTSPMGLLLVGGGAFLLLRGRRRRRRNPARGARRARRRRR